MWLQPYHDYGRHREQFISGLGYLIDIKQHEDIYEAGFNVQYIFMLGHGRLFSVFPFHHQAATSHNAQRNTGYYSWSSRGALACARWDDEVVYSGRAWSSSGLCHSRSVTCPVVGHAVTSSYTRPGHSHDHNVSPFSPCPTSIQIKTVVWNIPISDECIPSQRVTAIVEYHLQC